MTVGRLRVTRNRIHRKGGDVCATRGKSHTKDNCRDSSPALRDQNDGLQIPVVRRLSFVSDGGARRACEVQHFKMAEANFRAPATEVGPGIIKRIAKFDEHVQRHQQSKKVLAAGIINEGFNRHQRAARRESFIS